MRANCRGGFCYLRGVLHRRAAYLDVREAVEELEPGDGGGGGGAEGGADHHPEGGDERHDADVEPLRAALVEEALDDEDDVHRDRVHGEEHVRQLHGQLALRVEREERRLRSTNFCASQQYE